jgi:hypothetical protein
VLRLSGSLPTFVTRGLSIDSSNIIERPYTEDELAPVLGSACGWIEERIQQRATQLQGIYPWR